jgi:hypothetical protein
MVYKEDKVSKVLMVYKEDKDSEAQEFKVLKVL